MNNPLVLASKEIYLRLVHSVSKKSKIKNNKIVFLLSFPSASQLALQTLFDNFSEKLVICYTKSSKELASYYQKNGCLTYNIDDLPVLLKDIVPMVTNSQLVFCDNYFAFLAGINFQARTKVVQLWHANGAIKTFGLAAAYTKNVSRKDRQRYLEVYKKFTHYVVSSQKMANIFAKNYRQKINDLSFGYLPTDFYFDKDWMQNAKKMFRDTFSTKKKVALYVPTYRENKVTIPLNFSHLANQLGDEWQVLVKAHPHDSNLYQQVKDESKIIANFNDLDLAQILPSVDCLITDYSSIPFEYSLANPEGEMVFFCFDYEQYNKEVGIEEGFKDWAPGQIVTTQEELISAIQYPFSQDFTSFNQMWNEYTQGDAYKQLVRWVEKAYDN
ncbi:CDP-glycerol glycerophosphotransferase family protein [Tetragenococcus halophilus]|uniref:CDP-glycerol glycerophosphotransferase family protein n=1 Tax=Tetragenococcus halophilus TaxID=51669 RepID=UPI00255DFD94|nr:CDP-glycerol glycerophosphotransferase family protein [Tetragenococcus halophilus]GMG69221.1 CDP-glycerol glycerophosphotransferase family protein [Tetragenococcus halophilus]